MTRRLSVLAVVAVALLAVVADLPGANSARFRISATLDSGQEVPKPKYPVPRATGTFSGTLDHETGTVQWKLVFSRLSGRPTMAHVHLGKRGVAGPIAFVLCGPKAPRGRIICKSGVQGTAKVGAKTVRAIESGSAYANIHTRRNPAGEIRGQVLTAR